MPHGSNDEEKPYFDKELHAAYLATEYTCGRFVLQIGRPHPYFSDFLAREAYVNYAFLTAWNPRSLVLGEAENRQRGEKLKQHLEAQGIIYIPGGAHDPKGEWPVEEGYFVFNAATDRVLEIAGAWEQNAVVLGVRKGKPSLHWV